MMSAYDACLSGLEDRKRRWLITGVGGFIGSNLLETLLGLGQEVAGFDNFSTGRRENLQEVMGKVGVDAWARFTFIDGDLRDRSACLRACVGAEIVLHQAALGSVPRSMEDPATSHEVNVDGTLNLFLAAKEAGVERLVFASSSSVYGDDAHDRKIEDCLGRPLSPYAVTKRVGELYAGVMARTYGFQAVGLRYFNVFGPRQRPDGPYAAVIPRWIAALRQGEPTTIYGDGSNSRDFCYVANVVQANLLAATSDGSGLEGEIFNVSCGNRTSLTDLHGLIRRELGRFLPEALGRVPRYSGFRTGDIAHSQADIEKAGRILGYVPTHTVSQGLAEAIPWYWEHLR